MKPLFNNFNIPFDKNTCSLENISDTVKLFVEMTNRKKIYDIYAILAEIETLLNLFDEKINIFEKSKLSKSILPWAYRVCRLVATVPVTTASDEIMFSK